MSPGRRYVRFYARRRRLVLLATATGILLAFNAAVLLLEAVYR